MYLLNHKFYSEMVSLLYNLKCQSLNDFRDNFHTMHGQAPVCRLCESHIDSQELSLSYDKIKENLSESEIQGLNSVKYQDIFGNEEQQLKVTKIYQRIIKIQATYSIPAVGLPGLNNWGPD